MKIIFITFFVALALVSCKKDNNTPTPQPQPNTQTSSNDWYIFDFYSETDYGAANPTISPFGATGLDHRLDFRSDGSIYYYIQSVPQAQPAFWGYHTNTTITHGSGGQGSFVYQITNKTSTIIEAKHEVSSETTFFLTLKK